MRRKSERNKTKSSPEKKIEKPTRRTTRRRGKTSSSTSPERENTDENVSSVPRSDDEKESRLQSQEQRSDNKDADVSISSNEIIGSVLGKNEEDGSVWKVARQDASPGEIQKLKLCRQRNISETSDSPLSKKQSNKWPDSGEGGMEEADSADEQITSSQKMIISEQIDDPSSSHPGQDSIEEVSDYKENLPETTSANLSDDKTNIDQLADSKENLPETSNLSEPPVYEDNQSSNLPTNLPDDNSHLDETDCRNNIEESTSGNLFNNQREDFQENSNQLTSFNSVTTDSHQSLDSAANSSTNNDCTNIITFTEESKKINNETIIEAVTLSENETLIDDTSSIQDIVSYQKISCNKQESTKNVSMDNKIVDTCSAEINKTIQNEEEEEEEGEIRDETEKEPSPDSDSVSNVKDELDVHDIQDMQSPVMEMHKSSRKHAKYHESFTSDTLESDDEQSTTKDVEVHKKLIDTSNVEEVTKKNKKEKKDSSQNIQPPEMEESSISINTEPEIELSENNIEKEDIFEINDKTEDLNVTLSASKPAKVSLKRSFSSRLSTDSEVKKEDSTKKSIINESNQNKENHADNEQPDQKCATKRRRWGMTTSADIAPAFSISTDSLKALVPGAKPLSVNEVRLNKDEDDEKEHRKNKNEITGDYNSKNDIGPKSDLKKDVKMDNHIVSRRKITVVKETPRPKSPSPPEAQATNFLLIKNLVRPFTLNQIKELLSRTGTIVENGFWMDRIKSKCFVEYTNEDQAFETRQALHGVSWPPSNPKKLIVEYATKEDMESARETSKDQPIARKPGPLLSTDLWQQDHWSRDDRSTVNKITVIREWDLGKEDGQLHVKEKERERKELEKKKRQRSRSPIVETHLPAPARKFKKKEEEPPTAKLLDDLFRKTKSTPCIYWLPLTNEQILVKEEMRRQHMAEHARRLEEMRRAERNRDTRRRRSPRK